MFEISFFFFPFLSNIFFSFTHVFPCTCPRTSYYRKFNVFEDFSTKNYNFYEIMKNLIEILSWNLGGLSSKSWKLLKNIKVHFSNGFFKWSFWATQHHDGNTKHLPHWQHRKSDKTVHGNTSVIIRLSTVRVLSSLASFCGYFTNLL